MSNIPEHTTLYNLYNANDKLVGETETTLPSFEQMTNTVSGAGILGEYETAVAGAFSSAELEIPFRMFNKEAAELLKSTSMIFLRASVQEVDPQSHKKVNKSLKVTMSGTRKGVTLGTVGNAKTMDRSIKLEVTYFKYEYDGKVLFELDKLNGIHKVNGEDQMLEINSMI